jgi:hypothetical protein
MTQLQRRNIPPVIREALALHELFRQLGFSSDDIFVTSRPFQLFVSRAAEGLPTHFKPVDAPQRLTVFVVVRQGELQFAVPCSYMLDAGVTEEQFVELWTRAAIAWNDDGQMSNTTRLRIYEESPYHDAGKVLALLQAMDAKGFVIPAARDLFKPAAQPN